MTRPDLGFLLSLGALPLAGCIFADDDKDNAGDSAASTMSATGDATDELGATDPTLTGDSGTDPTLTGDSGTDTTDPTAADSTTGTFDCGDVPVPEFCEPYVAHMYECVGGGYYSVEYCACNLANAPSLGGDPCVAAYEDYYACLIAADCEQIGRGTACTAEIDAVTIVCEGTTSG